MFTLRLPNGKEVPLGYRLLKVLAEELPDTAEYAEIAEALLGLGFPSISKELIGSSLLTKAHLDALWETGDLEVRRTLVERPEFLKNLTDAQAKDIIHVNDTEMLQSVARLAEVLYPDEDDAEQAARLSGGEADTLLKHISTHPDHGVRAALLENAQAPAKFLPPVKAYIEKGIVPHNIPFARMTMDDIDALAGASRDTLEYFADNVEDIRNRDVRGAVAKKLMAHPDPSIRLALANNWRAPRHALTFLLQDQDPDIAAAAKKTLGENEDE